MGVPQLYGWCIRGKLIKEYTHQVSCDNVYLDMNSIIHPACNRAAGLALNKDGFLEVPSVTQEMMFETIVKDIERILVKAGPKNLVYMAIDGVAPSAKMGHQRGRRIRSALEHHERQVLEKAFRAEKKKRNEMILPTMVNDDVKFDSNEITPGTEFMEKLSAFLEEYVLKKTEDPKSMWSRVNVIFSSSSVPGEGEHKMLDFIRSQKGIDAPQRILDENVVDAVTRSKKKRHVKHLLVGDDADLLMLGVALHEPSIGIFRNVSSLDALISTSKRRQRFTPPSVSFEDIPHETRYSLFEIDPFRNNLLKRLMIKEGAKHSHAKRYLNDLILIFFLGGNDFLPHLPTIDLRYDDLDMVVETYVETFVQRNKNRSFLTSTSHKIKLDALSEYFTALGKKIELTRARRMENFSINKARKYKRGGWLPLSMQRCKQGARCTSGNRCTKLHGSILPRAKSLLQIDSAVFGFALSHSETMLPPGVKPLPVSHSRGEFKCDGGRQSGEIVDGKLVVANLDDREVEHVKKFAEELELDVWVRRKLPTSTKTATLSLPQFALDESKDSANRERRQEWAKMCRNKFVKLYHAQLEDRFAAAENFESSEANVFQIKVYGQDRQCTSRGDYYHHKFMLKKIDPIEKSHLLDICENYIRGMQWTFRYYMEGNTCWRWRYPFAYAPFARDLGSVCHLIKDKDIDNWKASKPVTPIQQLMAVLPRASKHAVPMACRELMSSEPFKAAFPDPRNIQLDPNGRQYRWQWVTLMPPLNEEQLMDAVDKTRSSWTKIESGYDKLDNPKFFPSRHVVVGSSSNQLKPQEHGLGGSVSNPRTLPGRKTTVFEYALPKIGKKPLGTAAATRSFTTYYHPLRRLLIRR